MTLMTSRQLSPSRHPCGALLQREFRILFYDSAVSDFFVIIVIIIFVLVYYIFLRDLYYDILMILLYICVT